ncbi:caffeic acid 3-O-methyltransferase-like protein [Tanacetum coccineum]
MSDSEEQFAYAMQLVTSISLPMVLLNATKLKVLVTIAKAGPNVGLSAHEIASHLSISNQNAREMLDRMLCLSGEITKAQTEDKHKTLML